MANQTTEKLKQLQANAQAFFLEKGLEFKDEAQMSRAMRFAHFWLLVIKSFIRNRCPVRASALAYTTLLALIPLLALIIGVSTSLLQSQGEKPIEQFINAMVDTAAPQVGLIPKTSDTSGQREIVKKITEYVANIRSGTLGVTGFVSLVLVAILLLSTIETTFNDIWGVARGRSWFARVVQYWAAITLGPIFIIIAIALTSGPYFAVTQKLLSYVPIIGSLVFGLLPFVLLICGFSLFYAIMPNTRVHWKAALVGGAVGGILWQSNNLFNVIYVSKVVTYSKIYGSFAMVPVFLVGMYFSWVIVLFGAQVAYAYQNQRAYLQSKLADNVNVRSREFVAMRLMTLIGDGFYRAQKPLNMPELSAQLAVPSRLVSSVLQTLLKAGLLIEVAGMDIAYAPGRPLDNISCHDILHAMRYGSGVDVPTRDDFSRALVYQAVVQIRDAEQQVAGNTTLLTLVKQLSANGAGTSAGTPRPA
jgi:membrane protein